MDKIHSILQKFDTISLDGMSRVRLMNRTDTKYVTTVSMLVRLLEMALGEYRVQEIGGMLNMPYRTCYFDTADCDMYNQHERGRKARQKIRLREYEHSGVSFLEIKDKNNRGRTNKKRIPAAGTEKTLISYSDFILTHSHYFPENLAPKVRNNFHRITMVNNLQTERLTIDTELYFHNETTGNECSLDGLVIIELKRDGNTYSPAGEMLRLLRIQPAGFSKYCMGMAFTNTLIRKNRLKPMMRIVERMLCPEVQYSVTAERHVLFQY